VTWCGIRGQDAARKACRRSGMHRQTPTVSILPSARPAIRAGCRPAVKKACNQRCFFDWTRPGRPVYHRTAGTPMCAVSRASGLNSSLTFSVYGTKRDQFTSTHRTILYHSCVRDPKRDSPIIFASRRTRVPRPASARSTIDVTTCVSARHSRSSCASSTSEPARRIRFRACAPACFNPNVLLVYGLADV